jgi:hypothetical protein
VNEHILFKLATRSRPEKAKASIDNIIKNCNSLNYTILVSIDTDDESMKNFNYKDDNVFIAKGLSKNKIDAINRDMDLFEGWDILINTSDDMHFEIRGFDNIIRQDFRKNYDQVLHYSDGNQHSNIMTMSIMGVDYYKRFNYIYHPDYKSLWCDCEATEVAWMLGKYEYMGDLKILFRHLHPAWGLAEYDEQYRKSESQEHWDNDYKVFKERKARNYDIGSHLFINPPKYYNV